MHQDRYVGEILLHSEGLVEEVIKSKELVCVFFDGLIILPSDHLVMIDFSLLKFVSDRLLLSQPKDPMIHAFDWNPFGFNPIDDCQVLLILERPLPICIALFFVFTGQWAKHDNRIHFGIPNHLPEVRDGGACRRLFHALRVLRDDATVLG